MRKYFTAFDFNIPCFRFTFHSGLLNKICIFILTNNNHFEKNTPPSGNCIVSITWAGNYILYKDSYQNSYHDRCR